MKAESLEAGLKSAYDNGFAAGQKQERERITSEMPKIYVAHEEFLAVCKQIAGDETRTGIEAAIALQKVKNVIGNVLSAEPKS